MNFSLPTSHEPSVAFFCPVCGEVWGRVRTEREGDWCCLRAGCSAHPEHAIGDEVPGSLLQPFTWWDSLFAGQFKTAIRTIPEDWLCYEFGCHMKHFEEYFNDHHQQPPRR